MSAVEKPGIADHGRPLTAAERAAAAESPLLRNPNASFVDTANATPAVYGHKYNMQPSVPLEVEEIQRGTITDRAREYKKTLIFFAALVALAAIFAVAYTQSGDVRNYLDDKIFNPIHSALGDTGGIMLAVILTTIAARAMWRGANYLFRGVYISERDHTNEANFHPAYLSPAKEKNGKITSDEGMTHPPETAGDRIKEYWKHIALFIVIAAAISLPLVLDSTAQSYFLDHIVTPVHNAMGDVGGIMLGSAVTYLALTSLYRGIKYLANGKYFVNMKVNGDNSVSYHSDTWYAVTDRNFFNIKI